MIDNDTTDAQTVPDLSVYMLAVNSTDQLSTGVVGQLYKSDYVSHSGAVFDGTSDGYTFGIYGGTFAGLEPGGLDAGDFMAAPNPCQTKTPEGGCPLSNALYTWSFTRAHRGRVSLTSPTATTLSISNKDLGSVQQHHLSFRRRPELWQCRYGQLHDPKSYR